MLYFLSVKRTRDSLKGESEMVLHSKRFKLVLAGFIALAMTIGVQSAIAQDDVAHAVSGVVKSVDKDSKTFVVKASDGTEHTFKWTEKTTVKGAKDTGKGVAEGSEDAAKGTEKASEDAAKGTAKASEDAAKGTKKASVETYLGAKKGTAVTVKYTEKAGEKTAVGIKDASKATAKAVAD
jgi:hypothetical protein